MNKKTLAKNKKAFFDYEITDTLEAGIALNGSEVKSVKSGHIQLKGSYISIRGAEAFLVGAHISPYSQGESFEPERLRKLLLKKQEIKNLSDKLNTAGLTILPTEVYLKKNLIKVAISIGRGKKKYDKRETQKKRDIERSLRKEYKNIKI